MAEEHDCLARYTTLRLGGPAARLVHANSERQLLDAVRTADAAHEPLLLLAGGSNLVVADSGFPGTVVRVETRGVSVDQDACGGAMVTVAAGEAWDDLVARAVANGWVGIEALSGIPGSVGATPIQNVGAYGQEVAETVASVRCWDRVGNRLQTFASADCDFGYRWSRFKAEPARYVVLTVTFQFRLGDLSAPVKYAELARSLDIVPGQRAPMSLVRQTVLGLRQAKGMVLDPADHDTWSAGSFFVNPFLTSGQSAGLPVDTPRWEQADGTVKSSAAWLIEKSGFGKGYADGPVGLSTKHTLAVTNRGDASTKDLLTFAHRIQRGVHDKFGVWLVNEPVLVGCELPQQPSSNHPASNHPASGRSVTS